MSQSRTFDLEEAIRLFEETPSWSTVADKLGVHRGSIMAALKPLGYESQKHPGHDYSWDVEEGLRLRDEEGMSVKEIAKIMGVTDRAIYFGFQRHGKKKK